MKKQVKRNDPLVEGCRKGCKEAMNWSSFANVCNLYVSNSDHRCEKNTTNTLKIDASWQSLTTSSHTSYYYFNGCLPHLGLLSTFSELLYFSPFSATFIIFTICLSTTLPCLKSPHKQYRIRLHHKSMIKIPVSLSGAKQNGWHCSNPFRKLSIQSSPAEKEGSGCQDRRSCGLLTRTPLGPGLPCGPADPCNKEKTVERDLLSE